MTDKSKGFLKTALKIVVSAIAVWFVVKSIDWAETKSILLNVSPIWLSISIVFFVLSKFLSAIRLNYYFREIELNISERYNLRLAWIGMFYNLFLPGGIGGDGYKAFLLKDKTSQGLKLIGAAILLDRLSGMVALAFLMASGMLFLSQIYEISWLWWLTLLGFVGLLPIWKFASNKIFGSFKRSFWVTQLFSFGVQVSQCISAFFILKSLGIGAQILEYVTLFLLSSVVAVLPFTVGGIGAREMTFVLADEFLGINQNSAVAFSMIFFLITALVSLFGAFFSSEERP